VLQSVKSASDYNALSQCLAVCCIVLRCVAVHCGVFRYAKLATEFKAAQIK